MLLWIALSVVTAFVAGYGVALYRKRKDIRVEFTIGPVTQK